MRQWKSLLVFVLLVAIAAAGGALNPAGAWYATLNKPFFNPPNWIFPPAWTVLYVLMAVAASRVYRVAGFGREVAFWLAQLVCNAAWSVLFFGMHRIAWGMLDLVLMLALIIATTILFWRRDRTAGLLMLPYIGWVSFASVLNMSIWWLNRA